MATIFGLAPLGVRFDEGMLMMVVPRRNSR
jgi:hypothetical protein